MDITNNSRDHLHVCLPEWVLSYGASAVTLSVGAHLSSSPERKPRIMHSYHKVHVKRKDPFFLPMHYLLQCLHNTQG